MDKYTIHLTGVVIPNGPDRPGFPVRSELEHRKKQTKKGPNNRWHIELAKAGMQKDAILRETKTAIENAKIAEKEILGFRKDLREKELTQALESGRVKNKEPDSYASLCKAREIVRESRKVLFPLETNLRRLHQKCYYWRNMEKAARSKSSSICFTKKQRDTINFTTPTWDHFTVEDGADRIDLSDLLRNARGKGRLIVYAGTDYGLRTMSETVVQTHHQIEEHINRYHQLFGKTTVQGCLLCSFEIVVLMRTCSIVL